MALAGYAVGAAHGFVLVALRVPALQAGARGRRSAQARAEGWLGEDILGSGFDFDVTIVEGAGSYVVGEETALLACLQGLRGTVSARPPFPAERGVHGLPTVVNNVETLCNIPFIARARRRRLQGAQPRRDARAPSSSASTSASRGPGVYEVPVRHDRARAVRGASPAACATGARSRRCRSAARSAGILPGVASSTRRSTSTRSPPRAAWSATAAIVAFDDRTDMRASPRHLLHFGAARELRQVLPVPDRPARAHDDVRRRRRRSTARGSRQLLETLELGSLCAHGGGMPAPIRSLLAHFPEELGLA